MILGNRRNLIKQLSNEIYLINNIVIFFFGVTLQCRRTRSFKVATANNINALLQIARQLLLLYTSVNSIRKIVINRLLTVPTDVSYCVIHFYTLPTSETFRVQRVMALEHDPVRLSLRIRFQFYMHSSNTYARTIYFRRTTTVLQPCTRTLK